MCLWFALNVWRYINLFCLIDRYRMMRGVCLSVCLSVVCLNLTREWKGLGIPKLAEWKPITSNPWTYLKITVARPTNAEIESASYLQNRKTYELQTWYTDGARRPISLKRAMTSRSRLLCHMVVWQMLALKSCCVVAHLSLIHNCFVVT